jgi:hypothetical protein
MYAEQIHREQEVEMNPSEGGQPEVPGYFVDFVFNEIIWSYFDENI